MEKDGEGQLNQSCAKVSVHENKEGKEYPACNKKRGRPIGLVTPYVESAY